MRCELTRQHLRSSWGEQARERRKRVTATRSTLSTPVFELQRRPGFPSFKISNCLPIKLRVKRDRARLEVDPLDVRRRFSRAVLTVHSRIFPLDAQRALVA